MRSKPSEFLEACRVKWGPLGSTPEEGNNGAFNIRYQGNEIHVIASDGEGWDHVSVSMGGSKTRCPYWHEMCYIKDLFWSEDELVIQFHPRKEDYINNHPGVLHMWKKQNSEQATPPKWMV